MKFSIFNFYIFVHKWSFDSHKYCQILIIRTRGFVFGNVAALPGNKQLLDEVEHDIMNYQNRGLCYLPKPKAEADNADTRF